MFIAFSQFSGYTRAPMNRTANNSRSPVVPLSGKD